MTRVVNFNNVFANICNESIFISNSNKDLYNATHDYHVLKKVSIDSQGSYNDWGRQMTENPELLRRKGLHHYFSLDQPVEGLTCLRHAAHQNHYEASYTLGMILMSHGGEDIEEAHKIFNWLESELEMRRYIAMTSKVSDCLHELGVTRRLEKDGLVVNCWNNNHTPEYIIAIGNRYHKDIDNCLRCKWYHEYVNFCTMMQGM